MKRMKTVVLALGAAALLFTGCGKKEDTTDALSRIKEEGTLIVGLDDSFPPMGFRDEAGEITGFDIDMAKALGENLGVKVKFQSVDWDGVILSLKKGDIDLIWNGMTITESRQKQIAFSSPYLNNRQVIISRNENPVNTKAALEGKTLGLQMGSSAESAVAADPASSTLKEIRKYSNNVEALMDLAAGRIDAVVVDEIVGRYYIAKKPGIYTVAENDDFGKELYGVGLRKEDVKLKEALDAILAEMNEDGTSAAISESWFGEDIVLR